MFDDEPEIEVRSATGGLRSFSTESGEPAGGVSSQIGDENYAYTAETFFQANNFLTEKLVETAIGDASGETALDLYCGVGLFTLPLARRFKEVFGIEENRVAIDLPKRTSLTAGLENVAVRATKRREISRGR